MSLPSMAAGGVAKTALAVTVSLHPAAAHNSSRYVTVEPGNTLSSISQRAYGTAADWPAVWLANRRIVPNPSSLQIGQRLRLPGRPTVSPALTRAALAAIPAPAPQPASLTPVTTAAPGATYSAVSGGYQACVIAAESGGNSAAVNPATGAGGLYGFLPSTWQALGFSGLPQNAPVSVQNAAFAMQYAQSGTSAWSPYDGC